MSAFVNVGAVDHRGKRIPTKKALKEIVAKVVTAKTFEDGVMFDQTSMMQSGRIPGNATVQDLMNAPAGTELQVVGPDPYSKRNWYATVKVDRNGKVTVT
jgi:hypothetical protein